jgi:Zn-dependent peptidase ImmA (M78 family)/transcriptional regulator with XRE-family HTH domain
MIFGERVREARELVGLSQRELAERVGIDRSAIAHIEAGAWQPRPEVIDSIGSQLGFPPVFFEDDASVEFPLGSLLFRAPASITATEKAQAHRYGQLIYRVTRPLLDRVRVPAVTIPRLPGSDPEAAAARTRASMGLSPDTPIRHLVNSIERAGVLVLAIPIQMPRREAYSLWVGEDSLKPVVVTIGSPPGDRLRFSVAHELGHLVMGESHSPRPRDIETRANEFAGFLLFPRAATEFEMRPPVTLSSLAHLKPRWGMSLQALVSHAHRLELITDRQQRYLYQQITMRGWRKVEPANLAVPVEKPRAIRKVLEGAYGSPIDYRRAAADLRLHPHFLRALVEPYATRSERPRQGRAIDSRTSNVISLAGRHRPTPV